MNKFYVTTPIYYVNDKPHIGHTYTTVVADAVARFHRLHGDEVLFSVGVDENSQKNVQAMEKAGESDLNGYLDRMAGTWKQTWDDLGITYDTFIRTTDVGHTKAVERFWDAVKQSGDIYAGTYEGLYCVGCEAFKTESEIVNERCVLHPNKDLEKIKEKNYYFKAGAYRDALLKRIDEQADFVQPESRRNEIRNYIKDHFADFSISREAKNLQVGIPVPGDDSQKIYVWFDALINYITVAGYGSDDAKFADWWPADLHLVGKDIIKFHCALWPAMLMSAAKNDLSLRDEQGGPKLPKHVFAHGFFTIDGQKISKSLGNAVDPRELVPTYGFDAIRYFLLRDIPFGEDGDFSRERITERYVHDLSNTLGNLVNRAVAMSRKYSNNCIPTKDGNGPQFVGADKFKLLKEMVITQMQHVRFDEALATLWHGVDGNEGLLQANKFIEDTQPFKLVKTDPEAVQVILYSLLEYCRIVAWLIEPVMPDVARRMIEQLGQDPDAERQKGIEVLLTWGGLQSGSALPEPKILFPQLQP
ncbi:MAG: methionine--tRNA ligase [Patescibacteria group bacterium]